jgi:high affinity Mn2+ porin
MINRVLLFVLFSCIYSAIFSQNDSTVSKGNWNFHFQQTVIAQGKLSMRAPYSGAHSLSGVSESAISLTTTFFVGRKLWKNAEAYFNPELAGGSGISKALGVAGFPNGETFRIGDPKPQMYAARLYISQAFNFGEKDQQTEDDVNQLSKKYSSRRLILYAGKFSIADLFDKNRYSHDPRNQFMNWALMSTGAWDYPANTRGYTWSLAAEYYHNNWAVRGAWSMVPITANGSKMDTNLKEAGAFTLEGERNHKIGNREGCVRVLLYYNTTHMGNYRQSISDSIPPDITSSRQYGHTKYGWSINVEQELTNHLGFFMRTSWNDGNNETWAFTEIDRSISGGLVLDGSAWKRKDDEFGFALILDGISSPHRDYLAAGGNGFMLGDGQLNYGNEFITELYYNIHLHDLHFWITPDYQLIINPGYNRDRGPANVFALRAHVAF